MYWFNWVCSGIPLPHCDRECVSGEGVSVSSEGVMRGCQNIKQIWTTLE